MLAVPDQVTIDILWFKRDLRLRDHAPLQAAIISGQFAPRRPLLMLYCFEPSLIADPNYDRRHWRFVHECLTDIQQQFASLPAPPSDMQQLVHEWLPFEFEKLVDDSPPQTGSPALWVFHREVIDVLTALQTQFAIGTIFSHQETGIAVTYERDKAIAQFCRQQSIDWREFQNNGVIRALKNRDTWSAD
jgi:deoxyribodipyrimidine photo-lyase